jgi:hypothetical protein
MSISTSAVLAFEGASLGWQDNEQESLDLVSLGFDISNN